MKQAFLKLFYTVGVMLLFFYLMMPLISGIFDLIFYVCIPLSFSIFLFDKKTVLKGGLEEL